MCNVDSCNEEFFVLWTKERLAFVVSLYLFYWFLQSLQVYRGTGHPNIRRNISIVLKMKYPRMSVFFYFFY